MNRLWGLFFTILIAACFAAGCAPAGSIGDIAYDDFWAVPKRSVYSERDAFRRDTDISILASFQGAIDSIPPDKVTIEIIDNPDSWNEEDKQLVPRDEGCFFKSTGRKLVRVTWNKMNSEYSIHVLDPNGGDGSGGSGSGGGGSGSGDGSGGGLGVEW